MIGACEVFCESTLRVPASPVNVPSEWRTVKIPARDHVALDASFVTPQNAAGNCVLLVHGIGFNRGSMKGFVPLFANHGYQVLLPDDRAHGNSGGAVITYGLLEKYDAIDWAHWL